jgi:hypothetical protein
MTCTCRIVYCNYCGELTKPIHKMLDARRYCEHCGGNLGIRACQEGQSS